MFMNRGYIFFRYGDPSAIKNELAYFTERFANEVQFHDYVM